MVESHVNGGITVGSKLRNGAIVHAAKLYPAGGFVVMADFGSEHVAKWVTWRSDDQGNCYWGHYFRSQQEAMADFLKR